MPVVSIDAARLNALLANSYAPERLSDALEQIGCDVEEVVELGRFRCPVCASMVEGSQGAETRVCGVCGHSQEAVFEQVDTITAIRLDLLAARPDLFDIGGLARALQGYLGEVRGMPQYPTAASPVVVRVDASVARPESFRPHIRCAVVQVPPLDDVGLATLMKLQENLHWGVGRDRKLASIGVYDLDTLEGDIAYTTLDPDAEPFEPLGMPGVTMSGRTILEEHPKGTAYAHLLADLKRYPVLRDAAGQVLSMPPIINSEGTRVRVGSTRLFVDVTGPSEAAVVNSLNMLVSSLCELGGQVSTVRVIGSDGAEVVSPDLTPRKYEVSLSRAKQWLGLPLDATSLVDCFERMRLDVAALDGGDLFQVTCPAFRSDVRHMVDLFEDLAIGFGYENIVPAIVPTMTVGRPRPEEQLSHLVRTALVGLGYTETMSLPMTTEADHFTRLGQPVPEHFVRVANPKLRALTVVRSHLMGGVLQALHENRRRPMPVRIFELDNCVRLDPAGENGTTEERRLCFADIGPDAGYASVRARLDALLWELGLTATFTAVEHPAFVPGRVARFTTGTPVEGLIGEVAPGVLDAFGIDLPVGLVECLIAPLAWDL
ncbi:MAG: phenylalanine--tRNA ligase subunit beta [Myxococcales bacterium]|nr:phenylalanine--tRNA ligase subunit beta [Myxococcales bacterium]MCB9546036.1 phenylalanine--tRNA ligase subunit beta [Myxococcales bacterium]